MSPDPDNTRPRHIHASDRTLAAFEFCAADEREARWAAYQKALRIDGYRALGAPDEPVIMAAWRGPDCENAPAKRPVGRPPGRKRPHRVELNLTPEELARCDAERGTVDRAVWIRARAFGR